MDIAGYKRSNIYNSFELNNICAPILSLKRMNEYK